MANHKSAKKRSRQALKRNQVNRSLMSKIRKNINDFKQQILSKQTTEIHKSFAKINSSLARAAKKGLIKKEYVSRKLSSLSEQINKI
ncbi:MAG: 30S ribosomal protein S20 [Alphaproteobacteria bacterium MarineAlpha5_Bin8]|nr:MAG: 30S ribosomal protein S20 [Alphaproteobacteria bacterium MarineAlpha5_Bin7]PPR48210.1 MAG: 30S ribosomal protein S20 [Alphaproteobacteria bacterium MarineAlpha5_Bin8]PPR52861.1 MAG: 30S ribosomal protein S20 [Alphaproteobacteria bacterium MarineAlpha5_Bin6]|tara:strand:- start:858 stop:1118 length:261 start_codon:yes stop_codon:yes gene_type:complete